MTSERNWIVSLRSQWQAVLIVTLTLAKTRSWSLRGECNEPWQSTGNQIGLVTRLLRFACNDEWEKLDCFTSFAMTGSRSLRSEWNEPWQSRIIIFIPFSFHEKAPYHSDFCPSCLAAFSGSGVSFWRGGKMSGKVRFFIISRLAWAYRKHYRNDCSDAESWLSQDLRKLPWK